MDDYSHDPLDQLVRARYDLSGGTPVRDVQYSFDAVGNRTAVDDTGTNVSYTVNNLNQYTAIGGDSLTYDNNGNLATGAGLMLGYDAQGRLISAATATHAVSFIYDGRNRCVARTTVTATSGSTVWFVWGHEQSSHWGLLEERDADGDLVARYVHGEGIDEILRREAGASTVFYHHDALGSTIALTDASGALVEQYRYDVYGLPTIMDASGADLGSRTSALGNRFMFTGREWLSDLGLYDYRNRAYSPILGRWLQPDPIGFAAGDVNLYRYCGNAPTAFSDSTGLETVIFYWKDAPGDSPGGRFADGKDFERSANINKGANGRAINVSDPVQIKEEIQKLKRADPNFRITETRVYEHGRKARQFLGKFPKGDRLAVGSAYVMGLGGLCEEGARLQFYGCKVGLGPEGQAYVNETGQNAGMSVDAWTDNTEHCPKRGAVPSGDKVSFEFQK